jgi:polar amino acid transport system substrate-binding protein
MTSLSRRPHRRLTLTAAVSVAASLFGFGQVSQAQVLSSARLPPTAVLTVNQALRAEVPQAIRSTGELVTAGSITGLPVIGQESNGKWNGYLATITDEIGQILGLKIDWSDPGDATSASALLALGAGRFNLVAEGLGDTLPREVTYNFVDYVDNFQALTVSLTNPDHVENIPDACGKTFGLVDGSGNHTIGLNAWCEAHGLKPAIPDVFESGTAESEALESGQIAESGGPTLSEEWDAKHGSPIRVIAANYGASKHILGTQIFGYVTAKTVAGHKLDEALLGALQELVANGDYIAALKKWDAQSEGLVGTLHVGINAGNQGTQFYNPMAGG